MPDLPPSTKEAMHDQSPSTKEAIDAVYLVVGILHDLKEEYEKSPDREKLDAHYASSRRHDAILDVVKIWNQLPLSHLMATVEGFQTALQEAVQSLKLPAADETSIKAFKLSFDKSSFHGAVQLFCWYCSPFYSKAAPTTGSEKEVLSGKENLLECLHSSLVDVSTRTVGAGGDVSRVPVAPPLPTATQLVRAGLAFGPTVGGKIKAKFSNATLRVPGMVFNPKLETAVMNLLALERSRGGERAVARYLMLLRELVGEEGDVRVLGMAGVLRGRWRKEGEVVEFLRRVEGSASCLSAYRPIDDAVEKVRKVHGEWGGERFMVRNRPRVVWASAAALVSLLMAAIVVKRRKR